MIIKGNVIQQALLFLGNISDYNDTRSKTYRAAEITLKNICREICKDVAFRFSQATVDLTKYVVDDMTGLNRFNVPADFLGIGIVPKRLTPVTNRPQSVLANERLREVKDFRLQGNYIYSERTIVRLNYVRDIHLEDMPEYLETYITWKLARALSLQFQQYRDYFEVCSNYESISRTDCLIAEGNGGLNDYPDSVIFNTDNKTDNSLNNSDLDISDEDLKKYDFENRIIKLEVDMTKKYDKAGGAISGDVQIVGSDLAQGTLEVKGGTTLGSTLNVNGGTTLGSTLNVNGGTTLGSTLNVNGTTTAKDVNATNVTASGKVKGTNQVETNEIKLDGATINIG